MAGTYTIRPIQANLTHDTEWLGKMDPYCLYRVGTQKIKGPVCRNGGKTPKWEDATVSLPVTNEPSIHVDLMDKDKILPDDNIGSFIIELQEIQSMGQLSKWYPIYWRQKPAGEILVEAAYQPAMMQQHIQQPIIQEQPVLVKQTIVEPVVVEKVIREEVPITTTTHHQEFQSGPIIHGISHIHHGGVGHGLVPQQGSVITQGSTVHQGGLTQGTLHQGGLTEGIHHHGGLTQGGLHQGGLTQGGIHQGGLTEGIHHHGGLTQGGLHQGGLTQGTLNQGSLGQGSTFNQAGLPQGALNQGSLNQGEFAQGGLNQGNLGQGNLGQGNLGQGNF